MVLCDTNIFIHAFNGHAYTVDQLNKIGVDQVVLSSVTLMELYQGMGNKMELFQMKQRLKYFDTIDIDVQTSKLASKLVENFKLSHNLQIPDAIIGATAIIHHIPLYTYNVKDFSFIPEIQLF